MIRDKTDDGRAARKVSLRSTDGRSTSRRSLASTAAAVIARAAGFSTDLAYAELVEFLCDEVKAQLSSVAAQVAAEAQPAGVLLVDKPAGVTSHDVVARVRRERGRKTGHAGTLDPFATGLLIVLLGRRATRCQARFMALAEDLPGGGSLRRRLDHGRPGRRDHRDRRACRRPGSSCRRARSSSARRRTRRSRCGGVRAYKRARRGEEVEVPERQVTVHRFEQLWRRENRAEFEIECSSGTYVRSLIADLGDAYCESLRRTAIGPFTVEEAEERA